MTAAAADWRRTRVKWARAYDSDLDRAWLRTMAEIHATNAIIALVTALTAIFAAIALTALAGATGILGYRLMHTTGNSMLPNMAPETLIAVQCDVHASDASVGDIIVFRNLDATSDVDLISHRVTATDHQSLVTKGDNNRHTDAYPVTDDNLVGIVRAQVPDIGWVLETDPLALMATGITLLATGVAAIALQTAREPFWDEVITSHEQLSQTRLTRQELARRVAEAQTGKSANA